MKTREIIVAIILIILSLIGHYYLSWHCTVIPQTRYILKFVWIMAMVIIGYIGLQDYEIPWITSLWIIVYAILIVAFGIDKIMGIYYHKAAIFRISSYQFTSPIPYLAVCYFPRLAKNQLNKVKQAKNNL